MILDAAVEVFSEMGSRKASMAVIAGRSGISPALLHHYFPTREDLLVAVIERWDVDNETIGSPFSYFGHWLDVTTHNASIPGIVHLYMTCVVEATDPDHPGRQFYRDRYERITTALVEEIAELQEQGRVSKDLVPERVARLLLAGIEGLQIRWLHQQDFDMREEFLSLMQVLGVAPSMADTATDGPGSRIAKRRPSLAAAPLADRRSS